MNELNCLSFKRCCRPAVFLVAALLTASFAGCNDAGSVGASATADAPLVKVAAVLKKQVVETREFSARLEAPEVVEIRPRVSGFISAVNFVPGAQVRKNEILFVIDPRPYAVEADHAAAIVGAARAKADLALLELKRAERLLSQNAIAQREFDQLAASQKELEARLNAAQAQLDLAKLNLSYTRVRSPISGRASKAEITVGNLVDTTALLTSVVSVERMYASFDGDEETFLRLRRDANSGRAIAIKAGLAHEEGFPHTGTLEFVDNRADIRSGSVRMRALLLNDDHKLAPGLFAQIQVSVGQPGEQLLVSDRAIGTDQDRKFVFVVGKENKAEYRVVKLGPLIDTLRVVRDGLKPGETVVVEGLQHVRRGAVVSMQVDPTQSKEQMSSLSAGESEQRNKL